jgi:hypothetical protein
MKKGKARPMGEIRQSQVITTFGPGAMVDLPKHSILIGGLDHWRGDKRRIHEERLERYIAETLQLESIAMYAPPVDEQGAISPSAGITNFLFPAWFVAQVTDDDLREMGIDTQRRQGRIRPLIPWRALVKGKFLTHGKKSREVVPVRFVQACANGHISDIDWVKFVHYGTPCSHPGRGMLWLEESGSGGDLARIVIACDGGCGSRRQLSDAKIPDRHVLGACQGHRPWLGRWAKEVCVSRQDERHPEPNRLLVRSASNAYFSQILRVISIPEADVALREAVDQVFEDFLQYAESRDDLRRERKKQKVAVALEGFSDDVIWQELMRRQSGAALQSKTIKQAEIESLLSSPISIGEDRPEGDFYARVRKLGELPPLLRGKLDTVVLVHRLREVIAQVGFTRFEASTANADGELDLRVGRAALAREMTWLPAVENRGEGIFLSFSPKAIHAWLERPAVRARGEELFEGFRLWAEEKGVPEESFLGLPYMMLHSLSHLLITAVSLDCGYASSAISERVYASDAGYGILLYTGASGAEGTLGGLVQIGHRIEHHLMAALEMGRLCSNDPVCAQHKPQDRQAESFLQGAACHGCLLIAETSCERRNTFLDRALVVETIGSLGASFFL